jgi:hypothetical protein
MRLFPLQPGPSFLLQADRAAIAADDRLDRARALRIDAERCFRLAQGIANYRLAEELEALGREFEIEAAEVSSERYRIWRGEELDAAD